MSLNIYANIKSYSDGDKEVKLSISVNELSDKQIVELKHLKAKDVVNMVIESADIDFKDEADIETKEPKYHYYEGLDGHWKKEEVEQTALDIEGVPTYDKISQTITSNVVDDFLITQQYDYPEDFEVKRALYLISEGYEYDDVASQLQTTTGLIVSELNKARQYFAPYAAAWKKLKDEASK